MRKKALEVIDLNYTYPDGTPALKNISLTVYQGESLAIIGPNGAGKSTLLLHLNGLLKGEGEVRILGEKISKENLKLIRSRVGIVFQDPNDQLFMPTVFDDLAFGLLNAGYTKEEVKKRIEAVLTELGLAGYESKPPFRLSLGEMKRVSLASVMVLRPEVLVLDEPTASLDPGTKGVFIELLNKIKATKIISTHDLDLVRWLCSRVILLDKGRIIVEGASLEILNDKELLKAHSLEPSIPLLAEPRRCKEEAGLQPPQEQAG